MDYYPEYSENDFRLYHHGILGMKWGKRHGPPYPLDENDKSSAEKNPSKLQLAAKKIKRDVKNSRERRKKRNEYDYKSSKSYQANKNHKLSKFIDDSRYVRNRVLLGKKTANRIEYDVRERGASRFAETAANYKVAELKFNMAKTLTKQAMLEGQKAMARAQAYTSINNGVIDAYARENGLNTVDGGFTFGAAEVNRGKKMYDAMMAKGVI